MSNLWQSIESLAGDNHVAAEWARLAGEQFSPLRSAYLCDTPKRAGVIPCPHGCGCEHEISERKNGSLVALCRCEPCSCDDFMVTAEQATLLELNTAKLGRAIANVFSGTPKETDLGVQGTKQIGSFGNGALPMVLIIRPDTESFTNAVAQLVARLPERFILLSPSRRFWNGNSSAWLKTAKAGLFDLESNLIFLPGGKLQARKSGGELFSPYLPQASELMNDNEARRLFALLKALELESNYRKAPVTRVFQLYCLEKLSRNEVAKACRCVPSLITLRLKAIHKKLGRKPLELRGISSHFDGIADSLTDSRARHIDRERAIDGSDPDDED
jgi:hypothetical protein